MHSWEDGTKPTAQPFRSKLSRRMPIVSLSTMLMKGTTGSKFGHRKSKQIPVDTLSASKNSDHVHFSLDSPSGRVKKTNSTAIVPDPENAPAKFDVTVADQKNTSLHAWVIMTGPIDDQTGLYKYSVMSDSLGVDLFIFARDVAEFQATDQSQVLVEVGAKGFIFPFNRPHRSYQGSDCVYPPPLSTDGDADTAGS